MRWLLVAAGALMAVIAFAAAAVFANLNPAVLYSVETDRPVLALTIDDGPDSSTTPALLDVLAQHDAHATFFVISERVNGNEGLVRSLLVAGHEIGNHMTQDEPSIELSPEAFERKLLQAHAELSEFTELRWFRPGSGWYDEAMLEILERHGYRCVLGTVYPLDAHIGSVRFASRVILAMAKPGRIIILHDAGERGQRTWEILREVLPVLRERGYRVVTVSELLEAAEPN